MILQCFSLIAPGNKARVVLQEQRVQTVRQGSVQPAVESRSLSSASDLSRLAVFGLRSLGVSDPKIYI